MHEDKAHSTTSALPQSRRSKAVSIQLFVTSSQPSCSVCSVVFKYCLAFLLDFAKTLLRILTQEGGTALRNRDVSQLRD